jgi:hypothetical protein
VKVVVDIRRKVLSANCEMHLDCYEELQRDGSQREDLWGANVYPKSGNIEYDSMMNVRPGENLSVDIQDKSIRDSVKDVIELPVL